MENEKIILYTTAPVAYDGFGTTTISMSGFQDMKGRELRKIEVPKEAYTWQTNRYASGVHGFYTQDELDKYSSGEYPLFVKVPNNNQVEAVKNEIVSEQTKAPLDEISIQNPTLRDNSYNPQSESCVSVETVSPASMRYDMHKAIETIDRRVNGVDEYVAEKLGYIVGNCSMEQRKHGLQCLCDAFSAEQVDALAVAIYNIEQKGQGCIIGDQTGIGKGRIAAGMIRYAVNQGKKPIFLTEKPNLFSDLFRDVINIGSDDGIPIEILEGYKEVARKAKKTKTKVDGETADASDSDTESDEEELDIKNVPVYKKNKDYPSYTYVVTDELGKSTAKTKVGKVFLRPFIINGEGSDTPTDIKDEQGNIIYKGSNKEVERIIGKAEKTDQKIPDPKTGKEKVVKVDKQGLFVLPEEYDFALATYSQFSNKTMTLKMKFLLSLAENNIVIMDESHNASGDSSVGKYLREVLEKTSGVTFLSATFAKRPNNMPIYASKTAMSDANMTSDELVTAIENGGVALQEIVASNLVSEGQMIRRERSFEGIETNYEYLDNSQSLRGFPNLDLEAKHKAIMDSATEIIRDIMKFQKEFVNPEIEEMDNILKDQYKEASGTKGTANAGVDNTPIFSGVFNLINQLLFAIKAEAVADVAIQRLKEGKKPVIAFANTMESFLNTITDDEGKLVGENAIINADFSVIFKRRLENTLKYTETDEYGESVPKYFDIHAMSPEFRVEYNRIMKKILQTSIGLCASPIDVVVDKIEKAGYSTAEVTGRGRQLKLLGNDMAQIKNRTKIGANDAFRQFNNNEVDCLLINQSGSTGASAHAIPTMKVPKDKVLQRAMIILQAELNINTEVQKRGRINRTGQILKPIYDYVISAIPAEKRLMMMLQKKLKSLDANTTSSQKRGDESEAQTDFLNKYGDELVLEYLKENPLINELLGDPMKMADKSDEEKTKVDKTDAAHRVSGRVAILSSKDQENFYREISQRYASLVEYLKQTDEYDLEVNSLNLEAETLEKEIVVVGKEGSSVFSRHSILEKCSVKNLKKPYEKVVVQNMIKEALGDYTPEDLRTSQIEKHARFVESYLANEIKESEEHYQNLINNIENEKQAAKADNIGEYIRQRKANLEESLRKDIERIKTATLNKKQAIKSLFEFFVVGKVVAYPSISYREDNSFSRAIFCGFVINEELKNPYAPSAIKLKFAIASSQRYVALPASKYEIVDAIQSLTYARIYSSEQRTFLEEWDEKIKEKVQDRSVRYIVTGNILQAFSKSELKGSLVSYTTINGSVKKGILLPEHFSKVGTRGDNVKITVPIMKALPIFVSLSQGVSINTNNFLSIQKYYSGYKVYVPVTKNVGGKYYLDQVLIDMSDQGTFNKVSSQMVAEYDSDKLENLLQYLQDKFSLSVELEQYQFERIKDTFVLEDYSDEEKQPEEEIIIQKLTEQDSEEEQRRKDSEFDEEQRKREYEEQLNREKQKQEETFELEKRKLAVKKKLIHLARLLVNNATMMARGGNLMPSDEVIDILNEAKAIGKESYENNLGRIPAQNKKIHDFAIANMHKNPKSKNFFVDILLAFHSGYDEEIKKELRAKFPEMYKNR